MEDEEVSQMEVGAQQGLTSCPHPSRLPLASVPHCSEFGASYP